MKRTDFLLKPLFLALILTTGSMLSALGLSAPTAPAGVRQGSLPLQNDNFQEPQANSMPNEDPIQAIGLRDKELMSKFGKEFPEKAFFYMGAINFMEVYIAVCKDSKLRSKQMKCANTKEAEALIPLRKVFEKNLLRIMGERMKPNDLESAGSLLKDKKLKDVAWIVTESPQTEMIFQDSLNGAKAFYEEYKNTELFKE